MADGVSNGGPDISPQVAQSQTEAKPSRWSFLKNFKNKLTSWKENQSLGDDNYVQDPGRRNLLKMGLGIGGAAAVTAIVGKGAEQSLSKSTIDEKVKVEGTDMHFLAQEFTPKRRNADGKEEEVEVEDPEEVVIFLVGAPMRANADVTWAQPQELANQSKVKAYSVDARPLGLYKGNAIDLEVEAIREFIKKNGFKKVTIFGHSIGAMKGFKLAASLEQNDTKEIQVRGLVAANPVGLYEQDAGILVRYIQDGMNQGNLANPRVSHESLPKVGTQLVGSFSRDVSDAGLGAPKLIKDQMSAATEVNEAMAQVHAPVVFLLSKEDKIAKPEEVFPPAEIAKMLPQTNESGQLMRNILIISHKKWEELLPEEQAVFGNKSNFAVIQREQIAQIGRVKDLYARQNYAPNSEQVRVIGANKYASHIAFTVERPQASAHVSSRIFEWMRRNPSKQDQVNRAA